MIETQDYTNILKQVLEERINANSRYSLRAFARDLKMEASHLSNVLNKKRGLSESKAMEICNSIGLNEQESQLFCDLVNSRHAKSKKKKLLAQQRIEVLESNNQQTFDEDTFRTIADWYHFAILELVTVKDFQSCSKWISRRLNTSEYVVQEAIERLVRLGLLEYSEGKIVSTGAQVHTTNGVPSASIRKLNQQLVSKAKESITNQNVSDRHLSTLTTAICKSKFQEYGRLIEEFKHKVDKLIMQDNKTNSADEVYCLSIQFHQLTS